MGHAVIIVKCDNTAAGNVLQIQMEWNFEFIFNSIPLHLFLIAFWSRILLHALIQHNAKDQTLTRLRLISDAIQHKTINKTSLIQTRYEFCPYAIIPFNTPAFYITQDDSMGTIFVTHSKSLQ